MSPKSPKHRSPAKAAKALLQLPPQSEVTIVAIGASAGGIEALTELLAHRPSGTGMASVLIQHLDPKHQTWTQASAFASGLNAGLDLDSTEVRNIVTSAYLRKSPMANAVESAACACRVACKEKGPTSPGQSTHKEMHRRFVVLVQEGNANDR